MRTRHSTRCGKYNRPNTGGPKALFNQPDRKSKQSTSRKPRHQITRDRYNIQRKTRWILKTTCFTILAAECLSKPIQYASVWQCMHVYTHAHIHTLSLCIHNVCVSVSLHINKFNNIWPRRENSKQLLGDIGHAFPTCKKEGMRSAFFHVINTFKHIMSYLRIRRRNSKKSG